MYSNKLNMALWCQDLAFDLSLSALLGENIYNFGELLAHPIVSICAILFRLIVPVIILNFSTLLLRGNASATHLYIVKGQITFIFFYLIF